MSTEIATTPAETAPVAAATATPMSATAAKNAIQELDDMIAAFEGRVRDRSRADKEAVLNMKLQMKKLQKELRNSKRKRTSQQTEGEDDKVRKVKKVVQVTPKPALARFLGVEETDVLDLDEIRNRVLAYVREANLKNGKTFSADAKLAPVLGEARYIVSGEEKGYSFLNITR